MNSIAARAGVYWAGGCFGFNFWPEKHCFAWFSGQTNPGQAVLSLFQYFSRLLKTALIPFSFQLEISREAADSAVARQGIVATYPIEMEMESSL